MKKEKFIIQPYYEGGASAMDQKITENIKYPASALANKVEGTVFLKYDINHKGQVIAARIITSIGHGCDEEAVRLVKLLRFNVAKQPNGLKVIFHKEMYIHFRLPKEQAQPIAPTLPVETPILQTPQYAYHYSVSAHKTESKPVEKEKKAYQIIINL